MSDNYIDLIEVKSFDKRLYFNIKDVKLYLVEDYEEVLNKLLKQEISYSSKYPGYIDLFCLFMIILFSHDSRTYNYKLFLIYSGICKINDVINPDIILDRINTIKAMKGSSSFNFVKNIEIPNYYDKKLSNKEIIFEEIKFSKDIDVIRQII